MDIYVFLALCIVILNIILSIIIPAILEKYRTNECILTDIKTIFKNNKQLILSNSIILGITAYIALTIGANMQPTFSKLTGISINNVYENFYDNNKFTDSVAILKKLTK